MKLEQILSEISPIEKHTSRSDWEISVWHDLIRQIAKMEPGDAIYALNVLIAPKERSIITLRAAAMSRVSAGKSYKEIGEEFWLSPQTISSIKKSLRENQYKSYRQRGKTDRKKKTYSSLGKDKLVRHARRIKTKYGTVSIPL